MKNKSLINLFFTLILLLNAGAMSAQNTDIRLGYCNDRLGGSLRAQGQSGDNNQLGAAIYIGPEILSKYANDSIYKIEFGIGTRVGSQITVFITHDLESSQNYSKTTKNFDKGWNTIELDKPIEIKGNRGLYIGYITYPKENEIGENILSMEFGSVGEAGTPDVNWYGLNGKWWKTDIKLIDRDFCIRAYAKGNNKPLTDVGLVRIENFDMVRENTPSSIKVLLNNFGLEPVNNFKLEAEANGNIFASLEVDNLNIAHNERSIINVPNVIFPLQGNNAFNVTIKDINGKQDINPKDNTKGSFIYAVPEDALPHPKTVLLEEFSRESNADAIPADSLFKKYVNELGNIIWIKHHYRDKFKIDNVINAYSYFFTNNKYFDPAIMIDRSEFNDVNAEDRGPAYYVPYGVTVERMLNIGKSMPVFASMSMTADYDGNSRKVNVKANIDSDVKEMLHQTSLRLTVYAVEDNVVSTTQKGRKEFVQNGIVRQVISNSVWGDPIDISDYQEEKSYSFTLPNDWVAENVRLVGFFHNYDNKNPLNCTVYNAAQATLVTSGIASIDKESSATLYHKDGKLGSANGYEIQALYDTSGRQIANQHLKKGIYLVKLSKGNQTVKTKYIID